MTGIQKLKYAALERVQQFLDKHADVLGAVNRAPTRATLDRALAALRQHAAAQETMRVRSASLAAEKQRLREVLRSDHMLPLVPIAHHKAGPGNRDLLRFKAPWKRLSDANLVAQARSMAGVAEKNEGAFLEEALQPTFVHDLRAAATAVEQVRIEGAASRVSLREATKGVEVELDRGRRARDVLGSLVYRKLGKDSPLLAGWEQARRIGKKRGRKRRRARPQ